MTKKSLSFLLVATTLTIAAAQTSCTSQPRQDTESLKREAVLGNIHQRKSVRDYTTQPVEDEKTTALLEAAMAAPSGKGPSASVLDAMESLPSIAIGELPTGMAM